MEWALLQLKWPQVVVGYQWGFTPGVNKNTRYKIHVVNHCQFCLADVTPMSRHVPLNCLHIHWKLYRSKKLWKDGRQAAWAYHSLVYWKWVYLSESQCIRGLHYQKQSDRALTVSRLLAGFHTRPKTIPPFFPSFMSTWGSCKSSINWLATQLKGSTRESQLVPCCRFPGLTAARLLLQKKGDCCW